MPDEPSLGELSRLILRIETAIHEDLNEIRHDIRNHSLRFVNVDVYAADERRRNQRFDNIEAEQKRSRSMRILFITLLVTAIVGPILTGVVVYWVTRSVVL